MQHTVADRTAWVGGRELHSGAHTRVCLLPAPPEYGVRYAVGHARGADVVLDSAPIRAALATASNRDRCISVEDGDVVITNVEHLNAVLVAYGIDNALAVLEKPGAWRRAFKRQALPLLDDSTGGFIAAIEAVGTVAQSAARRARTVAHPFELRDDRAGDYVRVEPGDGLVVTCTGGYEHLGIPEATLRLEVTPEAFRDTVSQARTLMNQGTRLPLGLVRFGARFVFPRYGLGTGISERSMLVMRRGRLHGEPRYGSVAAEFVRHKVIDFLGGLALVGPLADCHFTVVKSSHRHDLAFLRRLEPHLQPFPVRAPTGV